MSKIERTPISEANQPRSQRVNLGPVRVAEIIGGLVATWSPCFPVKVVGSLFVLDGIFRPSNKEISTKQ